MRFQRPGAVVMALLGIVTLTGCGGGGGSAASGGYQDHQDSFSVGPNQGFDQILANDVGVKFDANGTYPNGSDLTLEQSTQVATRPPTTNFVMAKPALELTSSQPPERDLTVSIGDDGKQYIAGLVDDDGIWSSLISNRQNGRISFILPASAGHRAQRSLGSVWKFVIGLVKDDRPDNEYAIKYLAGNHDLGGPGTIVCVHGLMDNYQSMATIGNRALADLGGSNVHSFAFPCAPGAKVAGEHLAELLRPYRHQIKNMTFVGYSQGVLVIRYALERLGETAAISSCIYIVGPNLGSEWANGADAIIKLEGIWLNGQFASSPFHIKIDDPAIKELSRQSDFLTDLNAYHGTQRGNVNYYLFNGDRDWVVSQDSALASGVRLEELTGGSVWRHTVVGATHFNIKSDVGLIDQMFGAIGLQTGLELTLLTTPSDSVDAQLDGWSFQLSVRNNTDSPISFKDLALEVYAQDSNSYASQWYDPGTTIGEFFPTRYAAWDKLLGAGQTTLPIDIHLWPDWQRHNINEVPPNLQAKTVVMILTGTKNGQPVKATLNLSCRYGDWRPQPPNTRSSRRQDQTLATFGKG